MMEANKDFEHNLELLNKKSIDEIVEICRSRNEMFFLFLLTKQIAQSDSIGEGYGYCDKYTEEMFNNGKKHLFSKEEERLRGYNNEYCIWLENGGIPIYRLYLAKMLSEN